MKIEVIPVSQLDKYMELVKKERDLTVKLHLFHQEQQLQQKRLNEITQLAAYLSNFKKGDYASWYKKLDPELKKIIDKNANR